MHSCSPSHKYEQLLLMPQRIIRPSKLKGTEHTHVRATMNEINLNPLKRKQTQTFMNFEQTHTHVLNYTNLELEFLMRGEHTTKNVELEVLFKRDYTTKNKKQTTKNIELELLPK